MKILVIVESLTGNTLSFVDYLKETYGEAIELKVVSPKDSSAPTLLGSYENVMIGCYTWDSGKIPKKTKQFVIDNRDTLLTKNVLIFGSGWTIYEDFCRAVDSIGIILDERFEKIKYELRFDPNVEVEAIKKIHEYIGEKINYVKKL